jgi:hypothetical protein
VPHTAQVEIRSFADLITPDERTLRFTPLGLSTAGTLKPEAAAEFQQLTIASADLIEAVPDSVRQSFERLRTTRTVCSGTTPSRSPGVLCKPKSAKVLAPT